MEKLLDSINSPSDLRKLPADRLPQICSELRSYMIDVCSEHPGHLGSSLGAIELITALHYVYDTPKDKIIFDVGLCPQDSDRTARGFHDTALRRRAERLSEDGRKRI